MMHPVFGGGYSFPGVELEAFPIDFGGERVFVMKKKETKIETRVVDVIGAEPSW